MSLESVQTIVVRAVTEPEYMELLLNDPDKAMEGYELTKDETAMLKQVEREKFDTAVSELEERVSRAGISGLTPGAVSRDSVDLGRFFGSGFLQGHSY